MTTLYILLGGIEDSLTEIDRFQLPQDRFNGSWLDHPDLVRG